jgi:hypothetical protein
MFPPHLPGILLYCAERNKICFNQQEMEDVMACNIEQHKMHMCALKAENNNECIKSLSDKPTVVCGNCGAKANSPDNVCVPEELA